MDGIYVKLAGALMRDVKSEQGKAKFVSLGTTDT